MKTNGIGHLNDSSDLKILLMKLPIMYLTNSIILPYAINGFYVHFFKLKKTKKI